MITAEVAIEQHPSGGYRARVDTSNSMWGHPGTRPTPEEALKALALCLHEEVQRLSRFRLAIDAAREQYGRDVREGN